MNDTVTTNQLMVVLEAMRTDIKAVYEGYSVLSSQIQDVKLELKEDIALVDTKVMGLAKRVDEVDERLSREIAEVKADLAEVKVDLAEVKVGLAEVKAELAEVKTDLTNHRNNTEMHGTPKKRALKKVA